MGGVGGVGGWVGGGGGGRWEAGTHNPDRRSSLRNLATFLALIAALRHFPFTSDGFSAAAPSFSRSFLDDIL